MTERMLVWVLGLVIELDTDEREANGLNMIYFSE